MSSYAQLESMKADPLYLESIGRNIWLMDDHRWAYYVWERNYSGTPKTERALVHIDYHQDSIYDYYDSPEQETRLLDADINQIHDLVKEDKWIRYDSFLPPALIRGLVNEVHYYCLQYNDTEIGISEGILCRTNSKQYVHRNIADLANADIKKPVILDFCIDVFNKSVQYYESDIWSKKEIGRLLGICKPLVKSAELVTVSLSFGYSGNEEDTRHLGKYVIERFLAWREEP